jgi:uroporphyrinogen-III decarboxylase
MTLQERMRAVLNGQTPDAMAWYGDLTYWYGAHQKIGDLPEKWQGERGIGKLYRDYNVGEYVGGALPCDTIEGEKVRREVKDDGDTRKVTLSTPVGDLTMSSQYSKTSYCWGITEHYVKEARDLRVVRYIMENREYRRAPEKIEQVIKDYGDNGLPHLAVPGSPLTELNKTWAGIMDLSYMMIDEPEEIRKTLDAIDESQCRLLDTIEGTSAETVMICENLSGETMGGYFEDYLRDYLTRCVDQMHSYNQKVMIHIDGTLRGALDKIACTGVDCVDAITPKPVGDVAIKDLRAMAGPDIIIIGGIPGAMFAQPFTAKHMTEHVKEIIREHKDSGKFILGVADQVPPDGDITLVKLISELVEEYGRY